MKNLNIDINNYCIDLIQVAGIVHPPVQECKLQQDGSYYSYNGTIVYVCALICTYTFVL